jgi:hypothetical protein
MRQAKYKKQLTIAISPEHFEKIKRITDQEKISLAEFCREALAVALIKDQQQEDINNAE